MSVTESFDPMDNQYLDEEDFEDDMPTPTVRRRLPALPPFRFPVRRFSLRSRHHPLPPLRPHAAPLE